jgi:hypothetical protein
MTLLTLASHLRESYHSQRFGDPYGNRTRVFAVKGRCSMISMAVTTIHCLFGMARSKGETE